MATSSSLRKNLVWAHRILGLVCSALFVLWFVSGLFMMYVEMPYLQQGPGRLAGLAPLAEVVRAGAGSPAPATDEGALAAETSTPGDEVSTQRVEPRLLLPWPAIEAAGGQAVATGVALQALLRVGSRGPDGVARERLVWRIDFNDGRRVLLDAATGEALEGASGADALDIAERWLVRAGSAAPELELAGTVDVDQWTLPGSQFARHRPLHVVRAGDGTVVHVSSQTGEVVQQTTRRERLLAYLGPIPHWLYLTVLRKRAAAWNRTVVWASLVCLVTLLLGLVVGLWSARRPAAGGAGPGLARRLAAVTPYRASWLRWHHLLGLTFGVAAAAWVFSGLLSMAPFPAVPGTGPTPDQRRFAEGPVGWTAFRVPAGEALRRLGSFEARELRPILFGGAPYWLALESPERTRLVAAGAPSDASAGEVREEIDASRVRRAAAAAMPEAELRSFERMDAYDGAYTSKRTARVRKPLPVYRAGFDDPERTVLYLDPRRGRIAHRTERLSRLNRVLYHGLHSWDLFSLHNVRPLWDLLVGVFMLGGLALSASGLVVGVRWLMRGRR